MKLREKGGSEVDVSLDTETERTTDGSEFREQDVTQFRVAHAQVTEAEHADIGDIALVIVHEVCVRDVPSGSTTGVEELEPCHVGVVAHLAHDESAIDRVVGDGRTEVVREQGVGVGFHVAHDTKYIDQMGRLP